MTSASALVVGSGKSSDVPSEARAAAGATVVRYSHDEFSGRHYRPEGVPPQARLDRERRLLLAAGYNEQAKEALVLSEYSLAAQVEVLGTED